MNKELERYLIIFLLLILIGLSGCVMKKEVIVKNPKLPDATKKEKPETITDSVGRMQGVADALVCVFSPETCQARKEERETNR